MKKILIIAGLLIVSTVLFLIFFVELQIGTAEFENQNSKKVIDTSYRRTIEQFIEPELANKLRNKVVFFNSWTTWCGPCAREIPLLNKLANNYKADTNIVFISYCSNANIDSVKKFLTERNLDFENFILIEAKEGLRTSITTLVGRRETLNHVDTTIDAVPLNCLFNNSDELKFFMQGAINENNFDNIKFVLDSLYQPK